jgi:hypothetical protein
MELLEQLARDLMVVDSKGNSVEITVAPVLPEPFEPASPADQEDVDEFDVVAHVEVVPKTPWSAEWHSLRLRNAPDEVRAVGFRNEGVVVAKPPVEVRFAPHSAPVYQSISLCSFEGKPITVSMLTSQPVVRTASTENAVGISAEGQDCPVSLLDATPDGARLLQLQCETVKEVQSAAIAITAPLQSLDNNTVTLLDGRATFELQWPGAEWVLTQTGCVEFRQ